MTVNIAIFVLFSSLVLPNGSTDRRPVETFSSASDCDAAAKAMKKPGYSCDKNIIEVNKSQLGYFIKANQ